MKQIILKTIKIENFKGIKSLEINFNENVTNILGANGTGKTTVFDAFTYLLFGKDSTDRKDFNIKNTVDKSLNRQDHVVEAKIMVDSHEVTIKRIYKEKWQKTRGSEEQEFKGNESEFYWNEVPVNLSEFNTKVSSIVNEQVFKMITSPTYFNSIDWKQRRSILTEIAGEVSDEELAQGNSAYEKLVAELVQGKTLDDYKAQVLASVKKAKDDIKAIPTRIDEVSKTKPESVDFELIEKQLALNIEEVAKLDKYIADNQSAFQSKLDAQRALKLKANDIASELEIIRQNAQKEANERIKPNTSELDVLINKRKVIDANLATEESILEQTTKNLELEYQRLLSVENTVVSIRKEWTDKNAEEFVFDESKCECPTCKRALDAEAIYDQKSKMLNNFNQHKATELEAIKNRGRNASETINIIKASINDLSTKKDEITKKILSIKQQLIDNTNEVYIYNQNNLEENKPSFESVYDAILKLDSTYEAKNQEYLQVLNQIGEEIKVDNDELVEKRRQLFVEIHNIQIQLGFKAQIDAVNTRIDALQAEEKTLAQQIANVEKIVFTIENFEKFKSDRTEALVNEKFKLVKFRMFESQINGGLKPTCEAMVNGVPISDANTASKINAGIDIINTLSEFYQVTAPIWCDNRESVTNLLETNSQIISLVVSPEHSTLTIQ